MVLLPRMDQEEGAPEVAVHQALLHDVVRGLQQQDVPIEPLFTMQLNTSAEMADCQEQALLSHIM